MKHIPLKFVFCLLLIEGFITISLEILSIRQLLPFVGNSVIVTSLIIGVFLLFLSFGYYIGGNCNKNHLEKLQLNFSIAACLAGVGLSYAFCQSFFRFSEIFFGSSRLSSLLMYLLFILAPVVLLLGQTIPITTNFFKKSDSVNKISSQTLFLSTMGSFLGAVLTSLVLLNFFGVAETIFFNVLLLLFLSLTISFLIRKNRTIQLFLFFIVGGYLFHLNVNYQNNLFLLTNNYANYQVYEDNKNNIHSSYLLVNNASMSKIDENNKGFEYVEYIKNLAFQQLKLTNKKFLIIGAGGFSFSQENTFNNTFTYLDIDPSIKEVSEKYFLHSPIKGKFIGIDARVYFNQQTTRFDFILSDPYTKKNVPSALLTKEYFTRLKQHLTNNGYVVFNIIADPFLRDAYSKRVDNTLTSVFRNCTKHPMNYESLTNIIYVCLKTSNENDLQIYTDNKNMSSRDQFSAIAKS